MRMCSGIPTSSDAGSRAYKQVSFNIITRDDLARRKEVRLDELAIAGPVNELRK
jgi:hypothetical protein